MDLSVIICSYNPKERNLNRVLDALKHQTLKVDKWELLLIDNNSSTPLSRKYDLSWHPNGMHLEEPKQGLTNSRLKGISESSGNLLIFVDDDNILEEDYLDKALLISESHPWLGAFGGNIVAEYEVKPNKNLIRYLGKLALRGVDRDVFSNLYTYKTSPYGAGLVIRRKIAEYYPIVIKDNERSKLDRVGDQLISSGDIDLAYTSIDMGYANGLFIDLKLIHIIPKERLELKYLIKLRKSINLSGMLLRYYRFGDVPSRDNMFLFWLRMFYNRINLSGIEWQMYLATVNAKKEFFRIIG